MTRREEMLMTISDMSKDAFGFRSRKDYSSYNEAELLEEIAYLEVRVMESIDQDKRDEEAAVQSFESEVSTLMVDLKIDRTTAVRWLMQAEDLEPSEIEHFAWKKGLPWMYNAMLGA